LSRAQPRKSCAARDLGARPAGVLFGRNHRIARKIR